MILKKNQKLKIATILPYKENYTLDKASAASLWVSEFYKNSKFKKYNFIYGHTKFKKYLTTNYININLKNLKSKLKSTTNEYSKKLIKDLNLKDYDIVEIHNRPQLLHKLLEKVKNRFIFYFHNDPLSMKGSQSINERIKILNSTDRIIFVSEWITHAKIKNGKVFNISDKTVALTIQKYALLAGLDKTKYAGHSLRSGFATSTAEIGADERSIMAMTGHKTTQMVRRYIQEANLFKNNALNKIKI